MVTTSDLSSRIDFQGQIPNIILGVGPCRSGTTAMLRVFAEAGIDAWSQPIKTTLRDFLNGKPNPYVFTVPDKPVIFIKETLGADTREESTLNPLAVLLDAGVPAEKLHVLALTREPLATVDSWIRVIKKSSPEELVAHALQAITTTARIKQQADRLGISTNSFVYESLRDNQPSSVIEKLFNRLGLPFSSSILENWLIQPLEHHPHLHLIPQLDVYQTREDVYGKLRKSNGLTFFPPKEEEIVKQLHPDYFVSMHDNGIFDVYNQLRLDCASQLDIRIASSQEWHREMLTQIESDQTQIRKEKE